MKRTLTFTFEYSVEDRTWTVTSPDGPGTIGIYDHPYEALVECAFSLFDYTERPETAPVAMLKTYHQLNLDFFPYVPEDEEDDEEEERVLSPLQEQRARLFLEGLENNG